MCLLVSSYTCGLGGAAAEQEQSERFLIFAALTFVLGAAFLFLEVSEFAGMINKGAGPSRSAFLSAFFTLVGMHGAHVAAGLIWLVYMLAQVVAKGLRAAVLRRLLCFSLFWHALDIVWIGVMTLVYLMGIPAMDGDGACLTTGARRRRARVDGHLRSYTAGLGLASWRRSPRSS